MSLQPVAVRTERESLPVFCLQWTSDRATGCLYALVLPPLFQLLLAPLGSTDICCRLLLAHLAEHSGRQPGPGGSVASRPAPQARSRTPRSGSGGAADGARTSWYGTDAPARRIDGGVKSASHRPGRHA